MQEGPAVANSEGVLDQQNHHNKGEDYSDETPEKLPKATNQVSEIVHYDNSQWDYFDDLIESEDPHYMEFDLKDL